MATQTGSESCPQRGQVEVESRGARGAEPLERVESSAPQRRWLGTRIFSLAALCGVVCGVGYICKSGYDIATDAFVVPVVLSPDSDLVIQSKLSRASLMGEQVKAVTKKEQLDADLAAADQAIEELKSLQAAAARSLEWTSTLMTSQASAGVGNLRALASQRGELAHMVQAQEDLVEQLKKELDAGLVSKTDYAREVTALRQLRVTAIENERSQLSAAVSMDQVSLTQRALKNGQGSVSTPEMLAQRDQLVRIKCDLLKLEAERRAKTSERQHLEEELTKLDELLGQLNQRPIFRAIDSSTNVAFIPYSQLDGVANGAKVYECVLGIVACKPVGKLTELLPGEVIVPDPWGSLARGRYAVMELDDQHAAQSKTLRVRPSSAPIPSLEPAKRVAANR
jgi:hypothetical protein